MTEVDRPAAGHVPIGLDDHGAGPRCVTADDIRSVPDYHWTADPRWMLCLQDV